MRIRLDIQPPALILAALGLLILPIEWFLAAIVAASVHECGHLIVLRGFRVKNCSLTIGAGGAQISTGYLLPMQEALCAIAGPAASFLLVLFWRRFPRLAVFGLVHGLFNLLPVFPMDGGRILRCILIRIIPSCAERLLRIIGAVWLWIIVFLLVRCRMSGWAFLIGFLEAGRRIAEKYLAKRRGNGYNDSD